jgi:ADP-ribosylation factor GTPase-activating protein 1
MGWNWSDWEVFRLTWNDSWDDATIAERYSGEVGEEWKERLSAKVEGKDYVPSTKPATSSMSFQSSATPSNSASRSQTPLGTRTDSPSRGGQGKVRVDDKYFAGLGAANASRPADLPPSQGGKYAGFGSSPMENTKQDPKMPGFDDLQRDPVAALTKGFGWFTTTVGKTAKTVNEGYIQPTAAKVCFGFLSPLSNFSWISPTEWICADTLANS